MSSSRASHSVEETSIYRTVYLIDIQSKAFSDFSVELLVQILLYDSSHFSIWVTTRDNSPKMDPLAWVTGILFLYASILGELALSVDYFLIGRLSSPQVPRGCNSQARCFHLNLDLGDKNNIFPFPGSHANTMNAYGFSSSTMCVLSYLPHNNNIPSMQNLFHS